MPNILYSCVRRLLSSNISNAAELRSKRTHALHPHYQEGSSWHLGEPSLYCHVHSLEVIADCWSKHGCKADAAQPSEAVWRNCSFTQVCHFFRLLASGSVLVLLFFHKGYHDCLLEVQRNRPSAHCAPLRGTFQLPEPRSSCKRKRVCAGLTSWSSVYDLWGRECVLVEAQCTTGWSLVSDLWGRECGFCHRRQQRCWSCPGAPPWWGCHGGLCPTCPAALSHYDLVSQTTHFNISPMVIPACCHLTNGYTSKSPHQWVYQHVVISSVSTTAYHPTNRYSNMSSSHQWVQQHVISRTGTATCYLTQGYNNRSSSHQLVKHVTNSSMGKTCHHLSDWWNKVLVCI